METHRPARGASGAAPRWIAAALGALLLVVPAGRAALEVAPSPAPPALEVFVAEGCPHCEEAERWLDTLRRARPELRVTLADVARDPAARERLQTLAREQGLGVVGVPAFRVGERLLVGWQGADTTGRSILELLVPQAGRESGAAGGALPGEVEAPLVGTLSASRLGLPLFTLALGLLDGFNPCAMWALLLILSLLVRLHDRRRMLLLGGVFVAVGGALYFVFLAAWLELFRLVGFSRALQAMLGGLALGIGALNLKDALAFRRGPSLGIPEAARPGIYARMRRVVTAPDLPLALLAVAALSAFVNLVELLCTAGFPAVYTQVLASQQLPRSWHYGYLLLYVAAYVLDDAIVLTIATITLTQTRLQERGGRTLKFVSGLVLLALGLALLLRPSWVS